MSIWKRAINLESLNRLSENTLISNLGICYTRFDENSLTATMPVDSRTVQPYRLLHGGASVVLAETLGSVAANLAVTEDKICVGLEVNANHTRGVKAIESIESEPSRFVTGVTKAIHIGKTTQIWAIEIFNERHQLVCTSRLTVAVIKKT
jgi:uncharacterized protein (TIGR00369 family)